LRRCFSKNILNVQFEEVFLKKKNWDNSETLPRAAFEAEIQKITDQLIQIYKPEKIILFGSLAGGEIHSGSDIDLFIIKRDVPELGVNRIRQLDALIKYKLATDFIVYRPDEVESSLRMGDPFVEYVLQQGRILYSAN